MQEQESSSSEEEEVRPVQGPIGVITKGDRNVAWLTRLSAKLEPDDEAILRRCGLLRVSRLHHLRMDSRFLREALQYWDPDTHVFRFPFGEMGITLEDVYRIWGVSITGEPVIPAKPDDDDAACRYMSGQLLRDRNQRNLCATSFLLSWFYEHFPLSALSEPIPIGKHEPRAARWVTGDRPREPGLSGHRHRSFDGVVLAEVIRDPYEDMQWDSDDELGEAIARPMIDAGFSRPRVARVHSVHNHQVGVVEKAGRRGGNKAPLYEGSVQEQVVPLGDGLPTRGEEFQIVIDQQRPHKDEEMAAQSEPQEGAHNEQPHQNQPMEEQPQSYKEMTAGAGPSVPPPPDDPFKHVGEALIALFHSFLPRNLTDLPVPEYLARFGVPAATLAPAIYAADKIRRQQRRIDQLDGEVRGLRFVAAYRSRRTSNQPRDVLSRLLRAERSSTSRKHKNISRGRPP